MQARGVMGSNLGNPVRIFLRMSFVGVEHSPWPFFMSLMDPRAASRMALHNGTS